MQGLGTYRVFTGYLLSLLRTSTKEQKAQELDPVAGGSADYRPM